MKNVKNIKIIIKKYENVVFPLKVKKTDHFKKYEKIIFPLRVNKMIINKYEEKLSFCCLFQVGGPVDVITCESKVACKLSILSVNYKNQK